ncbi:MAG TPA: DUF11 domain-containing protein [Gaiellaceae bacterium]|nr:DUF11 domain-containing protein [Gaiellaceae bacterium]
MIILAAIAAAIGATAGVARGDIGASNSGQFVSVSTSISTPGPVVAGVSSDYTVTLTNDRATPISNLTADIQGPNLRFGSGPAGCAKNPFGGGVTIVARCSFGTLQPGQTATIVIGLVFTSPGTQQIGVTLNENADNLTILDSGVTLFVPVEPGPTDLQVTGSSNNGSPPVRQPFAYTFQVKDSGNQAAAGVTFDDTLPASLTLVGASASVGTCSSVGNAVHCDVGALGVGQQSNIVITAIPTTTGSITDTASVAMAASDTRPGNETVSVTVQPK